MTSYCPTCGVPDPNHWAGCPEDHAGVGMPGGRPKPVDRSEVAS